MTLNCQPGKAWELIHEGFVLIQISRCVGIYCDVKKTADVRPSKKAVLYDPTLKQRATVTGKADDSDVQGSFLQVAIRKVTSKDTGEYNCTIVYFETSTAPGIKIMIASKYTTG